MIGFKEIRGGYESSPFLPPARPVGAAVFSCGDAVPCGSAGDPVETLRRAAGRRSQRGEPAHVVSRGYGGDFHAESQFVYNRKNTRDRKSTRLNSSHT